VVSAYTVTATLFYVAGFTHTVRTPRRLHLRVGRLATVLDTLVDLPRHHRILPSSWDDRCMTGSAGRATLAPLRACSPAGFWFVDYPWMVSFLCTPTPTRFPCRHYGRARLPTATPARAGRTERFHWVEQVLDSTPCHLFLLPSCTAPHTCTPHCYTFVIVLPPHLPFAVPPWLTTTPPTAPRRTPRRIVLLLRYVPLLHSLHALDVRCNAARGCGT